MKRLLFNVALACSIFPIYAMKHGKDESPSDQLREVASKRNKYDEQYIRMLQRVASRWISGESSAGILPFRITSDGIEILLVNGRDCYKMRPYTKRKKLTWGTLTGRSEKNESPEETALREGAEEMAFALDKCEHIIDTYKKLLNTSKVAQGSLTYNVLQEALKKTNMIPHKNPLGTTPTGKPYGSSFLYPIDVTEFAEKIIPGYQENDAIFVKEFNKNDKLYCWIETAKMRWVESSDVENMFFSHPGIYRSVQKAIDLIKNAQAAKEECANTP